MDAANLFDLINVLHTTMRAMQIETPETRALARFTCQHYLTRLGYSDQRFTSVNNRILDCFPSGD